MENKVDSKRNVGDLVKVTSPEEKFGWILGKALIIRSLDRKWCQVSPVEDRSRVWWFLIQNVEKINVQ